MSADRAHIDHSTTNPGLFACRKTTAITYARPDIHSNAVVPGFMHTALVEHRRAKTIGANDLQGLVDRRNAQCPTGKTGNTWDVAHAVLYLASNEAGYLDGTEIIVDGGLTAASSSV
jgi:NAD(P)-dependent dehydrogenase (short-subunit alcohol dehydrogenase family)